MKFVKITLLTLSLFITSCKESKPDNATAGDTTSMSDKQENQKKLPTPTMEELRAVLLKYNVKATLYIARQSPPRQFPLEPGTNAEEIKERATDGEILMIRGLNLFDTDITNKEFRVLSLLPNLSELWLNNTQVSDLSPLSDLKNLWYIDLQHTQVSDLSPLRGLKNLYALNLKNTQVCDLSPLRELKNLKIIYLIKSKFTKDQIEELKKALPDCNVREREPSHSLELELSPE